MLTRTFQLVPGIGPWRERDLWARGIRTWDEFPLEGGATAVSSRVDGRARERIAAARDALARRDLAALARIIPAREHWRLYREFANQAVFFDIETDGKEHQRPTVVSLFDNDGLHVFVQGRNLDALPAALAARPLWVTFNGACFDIPVLRGHFPELAAPAAHIDLRFLSRKIRLSGGLKQIEEQLGLGRPPHLKGANGWDAVLLWRTWLASGDIAALRFLVEYNLYDAFQLRSVLEHGYNRAAEALACEAVPLVPFERGEILYDVSRLLLDLGPDHGTHDALVRARALAS